MSEWFVWLRLCIATWLVGRHTLLVNVDMQRDGAAVTIGTERAWLMKNTYIYDHPIGVRMTGRIRSGE